jgi:hypothetical protein
VVALVGDQRRDLAGRYSVQAAIRHPPVEQVDVRLRSGRNLLWFMKKKI